MAKSVNFEFPNHLSPKYIEELFLKIEFDEWYSTSQIIEILQRDLHIGGKEIALRNIDAWATLGFGDRRIEKQKGGNRVFFKVSPLGRYLQEIYSTNTELFYDLMHYFFYSTWIRSQDAHHGRFWVYLQICQDLWQNAPSEMNSFKLASKLQSLVLETFPLYSPTFSERAIRAAFPWLTKLSPPFLVKLGTKSELTSQKRNYCTPQLFHLAVDLLCAERKISYGTTLNIDDEIIADISMTCLLDPSRFWEMAERTQMMVKGFEIQKSQWGPTVSLSQAPNWIELPVFSKPEEINDEGIE